MGTKDFALFEPRLKALDIDGVGNVPVPAEVLAQPAPNAAHLLRHIEHWARSVGLVAPGVAIAMFGNAA